jgi:hypothetical protein
LIPKLQEAGAWQSEKEMFVNSEEATLQARLIQGGIAHPESLGGEILRKVVAATFSTP